MNTSPKTPILVGRRNLMGKVLFGSLAALALSACGGGGSSSSDSGGSIDLLAVYNKLEAGMTQAEVTRLVGRNADAIYVNELDWFEKNQSLSVAFAFGNLNEISAVQWTQGSPVKSISKTF